MRNIIRKILREQSELEGLKKLVNSLNPENIQLALIIISDGLELEKEERLRLKKEVLEFLLNRIIKEMKEINEKEPYEYSDETSHCLHYIDNVKINKIKEYEPPKTKYFVSVNTYASNVLPSYDLTHLYSEIEWEFKKLTNEKLNIFEDELFF